jgi:hypothetical protein
MENLLYIFLGVSPCHSSLKSRHNSVSFIFFNKKFCFDALPLCDATSNVATIFRLANYKATSPKTLEPVVRITAPNYRRALDKG